VVDYFRKKSRQKTTPLEEARAMIGASSHDMDSDMDIKLSFQRAHRAMDGLTVLQREVLSLRFGAGLSIRETAESIGKKENAIKAAQHAAIKKLRTLLERPGEGPSDRAVPNWSG
jgi:RNA polymerase sigma-70 factor (ECF subfamily)